jgi:hypothetical protein
MVDIEEKVEYNVERQSSTQHQVENAAEKAKAGANASEKKVRDPGRDLETEYNVEKAKERLR